MLDIHVADQKQEVDDYMTQFGRVASLRLLEDKDGNRRGPVLIR